MKVIYLDYNATTPIDREVAEAMQPYLSEHFGNPSSLHTYGAAAKLAVSKARIQVAGLLGCNPAEVIFTSGGSESNNMAIKGLALARRSKGSHLITSCIEHPSVIEVCRYLERSGFRITYLPVDGHGMVDPEDVLKAITRDTLLISVMHSNNETGSIQPIAEIARIARDHGIPVHTDAAQSVGKIPVQVNELDVDLLSMAGHKLYAPKGVGVLFIRKGVSLEKLIHGADHEQNLRAGTENVLEIAGLGKACEIALRDMPEYTRRLLSLRDSLHRNISGALPGVRLNGHREQRLPNTLSLGFRGVTATALMNRLPGLAVSAGAACHAGTESISHVLKAMKVPLEEALGTIRFSVGKYTTPEEVGEASQLVVGAVRELIGPGRTEGKTDHPELVRLTSFSHGLGCACKIQPRVLDQALRAIRIPDDPDVLVGLSVPDDAAVFKISDHLALVQTLDVITPVVDEPYHFGAIAAANALSDVYAMGGRPLFALSFAGFPQGKLPVETLREILAGACDKVAEAGIAIIGGHMVDDPEPKFGLSVCGRVDPAGILTNRGARPGDALVMTKPLGFGILAAAMKRGLLSSELHDLVIRLMSTLNASALEAASGIQVNACTDITGFGLLGHLKEMVTGSGTGATIFFKNCSCIQEAYHLAMENIVPGALPGNLENVAAMTEWDDRIGQAEKSLLCDPQTSGGLLFSVPRKEAARLHGKLLEKGLVYSSIIGRIEQDDKPVMRVRYEGQP
jgi:cysteine desulfurase NifS/selenium donor protein